MIIKGTNGFDAAKAYAAQLQKQEKANANKNYSDNKVERADILDISPEARQAQIYRAALKEIPEVREDLVASIKKRIQEGTYKPDAGKIADGILADKLSIDIRR
ncbi:MAG: Anti-sigma-28 factor, FlgM [Pelotomaculum sp. PtaB.Bin104]|nr:MAG: Anti-sigma-28 factor, FlgM [Pelotomaculum sp. PtaB.Bin104]